jgi:phosphoglycerate dehydrogenase-like enzyme
LADRLTALFAMRAQHVPQFFPPDALSELQKLVDIDPELVAERFDEPAVRAALATTDVLITGWGCPPVDATVLAAAPRLRAVLHAAGSVKSHVTEACWDHGLLVSSSAEANAVPVAEYTLAAILFAGKGIFSLRERYRADRGFTLAEMIPDIGNFGCRVGIIGASSIGRRVIRLLQPFDVEVLVTDPYLDADEAEALGARLADLNELLGQCDIVSVHAPSTPQTRGMLGSAGLMLMRDGAVLINTARGELVDTDALIAEVSAGRLTAVLDVTDPEPLPPGSPLFDLPGVFLTPHVAGSHGNEIERLGRSTVAELRRLVDGEPLANQVQRAMLSRSA